MAQKQITIDSTVIYQPDKDLSVEFETTYTGDSTRTQDGAGHFSPMFTVESFGYSATHVPVADARTILQLVVGRSFSLYYYSPYYGAWRTDTFYVGKGSMSIGTLEENGETLSKLSFNMIGVNPIA